MKDETWIGGPVGLSGHHIADEEVRRSTESSGPAMRHPLEDTDMVICRHLPTYEYVWGDVQRALNCNDFSLKLRELITSDPLFRDGLSKVVTIRREAIVALARISSGR